MHLLHNETDETTSFSNYKEPLCIWFLSGGKAFSVKLTVRLFWHLCHQCLLLISSKFVFKKWSNSLISSVVLPKIAFNHLNNKINNVCEVCERLWSCLEFKNRMQHRKMLNQRLQFRVHRWTSSPFNHRAQKMINQHGNPIKRTRSISFCWNHFYNTSTLIRSTCQQTQLNETRMSLTAIGIESSRAAYQVPTCSIMFILP